MHFDAFNPFQMRSLETLILNFCQLICEKYFIGFTSLQQLPVTSHVKMVGAALGLIFAHARMVILGKCAKQVGIS